MKKTMWHIVYLKESREAKFVSSLQSLRVTCFCPANNSPSRRPDKTRQTGAPLFPGYVFIKCSGQELDRIKKLRNYISMVHWKHSLLTVPEEYIQAIKMFTARYGDIRVEKCNVEEGHEKPKRTITKTESRLYLPLLGYILSSTDITGDEEQHLVLRLRPGFTTAPELTGKL